MNVFNIVPKHDPISSLKDNIDRINHYILNIVHFRGRGFTTVLSFKDV